MSRLTSAATRGGLLAALPHPRSAAFTPLQRVFFRSTSLSRNAEADSSPRSFYGAAAQIYYPSICSHAARIFGLGISSSSPHDGEVGRGPRGASELFVNRVPPLLHRMEEREYSVAAAPR